MKNIHKKNQSLLHIFCFLVLVTLIFSGCQAPAPIKPMAENVVIKNLVPQANEIVQAGLSDEDPIVRVNAIEVAASGRQPMMLSKVRKLLKDKIVPVRFAALLAIGDSEFLLAQNDAEQLLNDPDENVRIAAVYALKKLVPSTDIEPIRKAIASPDQEVRANAAYLLGKCGTQNELKLLYWVLRHNDSTDKVRFQAVESIARLGDERIYPKIWTMLLSAYADDRVMGIKAMGALATPRAREAIITKLDDSVVEVRLAAAEQLGILGDTTGEPEVLAVFQKNLISGSSSDVERIKVLTSLAIGRICLPSVTRYLPELLKDSSKSVRLAAAKAVLQCSEKKITKKG